MSESILDSRRSEWGERGFDVEAIITHIESTQASRSESVLSIERQMDRCDEIRPLVERLPKEWSERARMLDELTLPMNVEEVNRRLMETLRQRRPWEVVATRHRESWSREGRSEELRQWLERLEAIDESMSQEAGGVMEGFEGIVRKEDMEVLVSDLEERQRRRVRILEGMVEHLREERGWSLTGLVGNLSERYREVSRIQDMDQSLEAIQRLANEVTSQFDPDYSTNLVERATLAQRMEDGKRLVELLQDGHDKAEEFEVRLDHAQEWIDETVKQGYHLDIPSVLLPSDLLDVELRRTDIESDKVRLQTAWKSLGEIAHLFPADAGRIAALEGQLTKVHDMEQMLEELITMRDENDERARGRLASWREAGFETEPFHLLLQNTPRSGWLAIEEHSEKISVCKRLLATIDSLDLSFSGCDEAKSWRDSLYSASVSADDYTEIQEGIAKLLRRNRWHREMLDKTRLGIAHLWPAELDPSKLDLGDYEKMIVALESGDNIPAHAISPASERENRLLIASIAELDLLEGMGWDVSRLRRLAVQDISALWLTLPNVRESVQNYGHLRERLLRLPLTRDASLLELVMERCRRPEELASLTDEIPNMAMNLSALDGEDGTFDLFHPIIPKAFAPLRPTLPRLVPNEINEDYHEITVGESEDVVNVEEIESSSNRQAEFSTPTFSETVEEKLALDSTKSLDLSKGGEALDPLRKVLGTKMDPSPRDIRVQRLARLAILFAEGGGSMDAMERLQKMALHLREWTENRLVQRQASTNGNLFTTSAKLAERLAEIPGPGMVIPTSIDVKDLPESGDYAGLNAELELLERVVFLPLAGERQNVVIAA